MDYATLTLIFIQLYNQAPYLLADVYLYYFSYSMERVLNILENEDFFNGDVYMASPGDGLNYEDSDDEDCPDQNPDYFSSKQLQAPADFVTNCRNRIVNGALENDDLSPESNPESNESTVTSITDYLSSSSSNEDNSLSSSETSEPESETE